MSIRKQILLLIITAWAIQAPAQLGGLLKKGLEKGKKVLENKADNERDKIDSSDFNYAISVLDNSGMMNIHNLGEDVTKGADFIVNTEIKDQSKVTAGQKARNTLDIAESFYQKKRFRLAEVSFLQAKLEYESSRITNNINYSKVLADLGLLYATMGRYSTAEKFTSEALDLRERNLGAKSKAYASSLNNYAVMYQETARYNESEKYFEQARNLIHTLYGEVSQEYAIVLNNEAILFSKIGRYNAAIEKLRSAIGILGKLKKRDESSRVSFPSNLALLFQQTGKFEDAEVIYLKLENQLGSQSPYYAGVLDNLALLYIQMNKTDQVEGLLKKSSNVYFTRFGAKNPNYAKVLNDLGNFYRMQGRYNEAEVQLNESLSIRINVFDNSHPDVVKSEEDLGILFWKKGELAKALPNLQSAMNKSLDFINRYFPPMSESEKTKYWDVLQPRFQRFYNFCLDAKDANPDILEQMYDYQMATKALLLSSTNKIKKAILASGNTELINEYLSWIDNKEMLARYYSLSKEELNNQKINLPALEQETNAKERTLSQKSSEFSQGYAAEKISFKQIASLLADNEAVVELIRISHFDKTFTADSKYAALILTKNAAIPKLVVLENGAQLETRYAKFYRNAIQQKQSDQYSFDQYWAKIERVLTAKKVIYISPDGVYNQINLNTMKKTDGNYLINQIDLVIIGNSKDLISLKKSKVTSGTKKAFLLGFPDYGGNSVADLPGTKVELDGINKILKASGYQTTLLEQNEATEGNLKSINGPSLVHIATHGYFLADSDGGGMGIAQENAKNNPLLRSGLLLAGASRTMSGEVVPNLESNDNGVLTAYEAMNLGLEGTDLIVLSACETGLGEVKAGEGVYGLQRSFLVAGAKALVMSLWKVDDAATQALMTNFYTNLSKGISKSKAFKQAQLQLMTKYKEPYYWGAFVMIGL